MASPTAEEEDETSFFVQCFPVAKASNLLLQKNKSGSQYDARPCIAKLLIKQTSGCKNLIGLM